MKSKQERHKIIKEVVGKGKVSSQEELAEILENNGIQVAQATLSRDIRDLGITKRHDGDGYYYSLPGVSSRPSKLIEIVSSPAFLNSSPTVSDNKVPLVVIPQEKFKCLE